MDVSRLTKYWPVALLALWVGALIGLQLLRFDPYGLDENAAHALLLNWTVSESIANPVVAFQAPDFRSLVFAPLGMYWPGSFIAVKVFAAMLTFLALWLLYRHCAHKFSTEAALLGAGLLALAPITLQQINSLGAGLFLLLCFGAGLWVDQRYRSAPRQLAGWYFAQMLTVVTAVSLHPAGLGYAAALAYDWYRNPIDRRQQRQMWIGIAIASVLVIVFRFGWKHLDWFGNPLISLGGMLFAQPPDMPIGPSAWEGVLPALMLGAVLIAAWRRLTNDLLGMTLFASLIVGATAADATWAMLASALILLFGMPVLIDLNTRTRAASFAGQRGIVFTVVFLLTTTFMVGDKIYRAAWQRDAMSPHDTLISMLAGEVAGNTEQHVYIASQWPARTMLATKQPTFPLPPVPADRAEFVRQTKGIAYLIFDPFNPRNKELTSALSELTSEFETFAVEARGVIVKARAVSTPEAAAAPITAPAPTTEPAATPATP